MMWEIGYMINDEKEEMKDRLDRNQEIEVKQDSEKLTNE